MKQALITAYVFNAAAKTVDLSSIVGFDTKRLYAIINLTANQVIYAMGIPAYGLANVTGSVITLVYNTTAMSNTDSLAIIYDTVNTDVANSFVTKVSDGVNTQAVKAASTAASVSDPSAVVALSPNSPVPAGTNVIGDIRNISGTVALPTGAATEATLSAFKAANHTDLAQIDTDLLAFKAANHADLGQIDTDLLAFKSANHVDLTQIHTDLTGGTQKSQTVDALGNIQPVGDVAARGMFVKPTDGTNSQAYTASGEAKVLVTPLTNSSVVKAQLQDNAGSAITLGQKTMASSLPVAIASDQSAIPVSQSGTWNINNVSGTVSLPTNAAQETGGHLASIDSKLGTGPLAQDSTVANVQGSASGGTAASKSSLSGGVFNTAFPTLTNGQQSALQLDSSGRLIIRPLTSADVVSAVQSGTWTAGRTWNLSSGADSVAAVQSGIWNINNISGTVSLPTGASTEATLAALSAKFNSLGQKTMANSAPVVIASDQSAIPVSQSGAWTTGRTWALASGTDSVAAVQGTAAALSGKWPVQVTDGTNTMPTMDTAGRAGFQKITDGTNTATVKAASTAAVVADTALVTALSPNTPLPSGTNTIGATASESATGSAVPAKAAYVGGNNAGNLIGMAVDTSGNVQVVGNVASGAADSGNPVKVGGKYNSAVQSLSNGQRADLQLGPQGQLITVRTDGIKATYSASIIGLAIAATATDFFTITGSATKTIRVTKIHFSGTQNAQSYEDIVLLKRSTANSAGTSTTQTAVPYDSASAAATAVVRAYTANPTTGNLIGNIRVEKFMMGVASGGGANNILSNSSPFLWQSGENAGQAIVLRGTSEVLALNFNGATANGASADIWIEWTEE